MRESLTTRGTVDVSSRKSSFSRSRRKPTTETRRLSITDSIGYVQLNQYKLKDEIGKVGARGSASRAGCGYYSGARVCFSIKKVYFVGQADMGAIKGFIGWYRGGAEYGAWGCGGGETHHVPYSQGSYGVVKLAYNTEDNSHYVSLLFVLTITFVRYVFILYMFMRYVFMSLCDTRHVYT